MWRTGDGSPISETRIRFSKDIKERTLQIVRTDNRVDVFATKIRNVYLEITELVLRQADLGRRRATRHVDRVRLAHHSNDRTRVSPDTLPIESATGCVDIETSENLGRRGVQA